MPLWDCHYVHTIIHILTTCRYMRGLKIKQLNGAEHLIGQATSTTYTDDFSAWSGRVYLCGLSIHGVKNNRVDGMGAHWCHVKAEVETSLQGPK